MLRYRVAAILLLVQGVVMELSVFVALVPITLLGVDLDRAGQYFAFIVPFFQEHLALMMLMSGIFGLLRVIGAIGLLRNRLWGLALSVINCIVTMVLMVFMLPAGIADGLLSGAALVLILTAYFGDRPIVEQAEG